ncbi:hypothetical protein HOD61_01900 [archaeon]|nr:hypothetical protein [archaeon]
MRYLSILSIILVAIFVSSCMGGPGQETNIGGIDMKFLENQPTNLIREDANFLVGVELTNNIPKYLDGSLCIYDTPANSFGGIQEPECTLLHLSPAEIVNDQKYPDTQLIQFPVSGNSYTYGNLAMGVSTTNINAKLTYDLKTISRAELCLKRDPSVNIDGCSASSVLAGNDILADFAPVGIEMIEYNIVPEGNNNRLYLDIHLKKAQEGEVISEDNGHKVNLDINLIGTPSTFDCYPSSTEGIELIDNSRVVRCDGRVSLGRQDFYYDSLAISLDYTYSTTISTGAIPLKRKNEKI